MYYYVYEHKNKENGKKYIGITSRVPEKRWENGHGYIGQPFYKAIKKYGWDNFEHKILCVCESEEEAKEKEIFFIKKFDTTNSNKGYNATLGGESANGLKHTEETKKKISNSMKGRVSPAKGKKWSKESREKISGKNSAWYGRKHTEETRGKMSESAKGHKVSEETRRKMVENRKSGWRSGKDNVNARKVYCFEKDKIYDTLKLAAEDCGLKTTSKISEVCRGRRKKAGGYTFAYAE